MSQGIYTWDIGTINGYHLKHWHLGTRLPVLSVLSKPLYVVRTTSVKV